ncbi:MAG: hypothetical protein ACXVYY_01050 [Oryzihumus sp.]
MTGVRRQRNFGTQHVPHCTPNSAGYCTCPDSSAPLNQGDGELICSDVVGSTGVGTLARHMPVIDLDLPARLVPSGTPGHHHLYLEQEVTFAQYLVILEALATAGIVQWGYVDGVKRRGYGAVRHPNKPKVVEAGKQGGKTTAAANARAECPQCEEITRELARLGAHGNTSAAERAKNWRCPHGQSPFQPASVVIHSVSGTTERYFSYPPPNEGVRGLPQGWGWESNP